MKNIFTLATFTLLLLASSCGKEQGVEIPEATNTLVFTFSNSTSEPESESGPESGLDYGPQTKTAGDPAKNENKTERFDIFFFEGEKLIYYPAETELSIDGINKKVTITMPNATAATLFNKFLTIYVLANSNVTMNALQTASASPTSGFSNLKQVTHTNAANFNPTTFAAQSNFLMEGQTSLNLTPGLNYLGSVNLKRAAAKVIVEVTEANVAGYTAGTATATLNNYLNKSSLGSDRLYQSVSTDFSTCTRDIGSLNSPGTRTADPFYSYANDWELDASKQTYITVAVPWTNTSTSSTKTYYYRVPFNYLRSSDETDTHEFRVRRNYIYQFSLKINSLGSLDPDQAVEVPCNFMLKDWSTKSIEASVLNYDYLVVNNRNITMSNISYYTVGYSSSTPISISNIVAYCNEYAADGTVTQKTYSAGAPEYPKLTINTANNTINILNSVPINYVPRIITFTVTNTASLRQYVTVTIYPVKYLVAQKAPDYAAGDQLAAGSTLGGGTNNPMGASGQQNFNMFTITTTTLSDGDRMPAGSPFFSMPITLGDPTELVDGIYQTRSDINSNAIMSPKFVVASQRGISSAHTYDNAVLRCRGYQEMPYVRGTWRVPTAAELAYGNMLQDDPNSAVKGLFSAGNNAWWTAAKYYGYNFQNNALTALGTSTSVNFIRCVHDVWKDL